MGDVVATRRAEHAAYERHRVATLQLARIQARRETSSRAGVVTFIQRIAECYLGHVNQLKPENAADESATDEHVTDWLLAWPFRDDRKDTIIEWVWDADTLYERRLAMELAITIRQVATYADQPAASMDILVVRRRESERSMLEQRQLRRELEQRLRDPVSRVVVSPTYTSLRH